jgi:hypothetical protein
LGDIIPSKEEVVKGLKGKKRREALKKWRQMKRDARTADALARANQPIELNGITRTALVNCLRWCVISALLIRPITAAVCRVIWTARNTSARTGNRWRRVLIMFLENNPMPNWLDRQGAKGLITRDSTFNFLYRQTYEQRFAITAQLEPIREFIIDLNLDKTFTKEYSELFKDTTGFSGLSHLNPLASGGFSVSLFHSIHYSANKTRMKFLQRSEHLRITG